MNRHFPFKIVNTNFYKSLIVKLGSRSKLYLKSLIRDLDLELVAIIAMSPPTTTHHPGNFWEELGGVRRRFGRREE